MFIKIGSKTMHLALQKYKSVIFIMISYDFQSWIIIIKIEKRLLILIINLLAFSKIFSWPYPRAKAKVLFWPAVPPKVLQENPSGKFEYKKQKNGVFKCSQK